MPLRIVLPVVRLEGRLDDSSSFRCLVSTPRNIVYLEPLWCCALGSAGCELWSGFLGYVEEKPIGEMGRNHGVRNFRSASTLASHFFLRAVSRRSVGYVDPWLRGAVRLPTDGGM